MKRFLVFATVGLSLSIFCASQASAQNIYNQNDTVVGFDLDFSVNSSTPGSGMEDPQFAFDMDLTTKYLNFGGQGSGLIASLSSPAAWQGFRFTTGNDAPERDPTLFSLFGTNDTITSSANSAGDLENWTPIASNVSTGLAVDPGRGVAGAVQGVANATAYSSYRIYFDGLRDPNTIMQIADIEPFTDTAGTTASPPVVGTIPIARPAPESNFPSGEAPSFALDGDSSTKYLNFGDTNSGLIVGNGTPQIVNELTFTTANDAPNRDPVTFDIFGTNDAITSVQNGLGDSESWTLIGQNIGTGLLDVTTRETDGATVGFTNNTAFGAYRVVFTGLRDPNDDIAQIADIRFSTAAVPEPSSLVVLCGAVGFFSLRRRRNVAKA